MGTSLNRMSEFREPCDCSGQLEKYSEKEASRKPWAASSPTNCTVLGTVLDFREPLECGRGDHGTRLCRRCGVQARGRV